MSETHDAAQALAQDRLAEQVGFADAAIAEVGLAP
jgi:hypothetical protein